MISCDIIKRMNISNLPLNHMVVFMGGSSRSWQLCRLLQAGKVFVQACATIEQVSMYQSCARQGRLNRQSNWSCSQFCIHTFYMGPMVGHGASAAKVLDRPLCQEVVVCAIHLGDFDVEQFWASSKVRQYGLHRGTTKKRQDLYLLVVLKDIFLSQRDWQPVPGGVQLCLELHLLQVVLSIKFNQSTKSCLPSTGSQQRAGKGTKFAKEVPTLSWWKSMNLGCGCPMISIDRNCGVGMCMWMPRPVWDDDTEWEAGLEKAGGSGRDLRWASLVWTVGLGTWLAK